MRVTGVKSTYLIGDNHKKGRQGKQKQQSKDKEAKRTFEEILKQAKKELDIRI